MDLKTFERQLIVLRGCLWAITRCLKSKRLHILKIVISLTENDRVIWRSQRVIELINLRQFLFKPNSLLTCPIFRKYPQAEFFFGDFW